MDNTIIPVRKRLADLVARIISTVLKRSLVELGIMLCVIHGFLEDEFIRSPQMQLIIERPS